MLGDPVCVVESFIEAVQSSEPPLHLVLGKPVLEIAREELTTLAAYHDIREPAIPHASYPDAAS